MNEDLVKQEGKGLTVPITTQTIKDFLFSSGTKLSEQQQSMFMQLAMRNQLDPFKREIYAIAYGDNFNIVTGYQVYVQRADDSGKMDGWECISLRDSDGKLYGAKITIYRKDFSHPLVWEVALQEFFKGGNSKRNNWDIMPEFMIKKVAIGQGFRLAFPNELAGMPYLQEELEGLTPQNEKASGKPTTTPPQKKSEGTAATTDGEKITEGQKKLIHVKLKAAGVSESDFKAYMEIDHIADLPKSMMNEILADIEGGNIPRAIEGREPGDSDE